MSLLETAEEVHQARLIKLRERFASMTEEEMGEFIDRLLASLEEDEPALLEAQFAASCAGTDIDWNTWAESVRGRIAEARKTDPAPPWSKPDHETESKELADVPAEGFVT